MRLRDIPGSGGTSHWQIRVPEESFGALMRHLKDKGWKWANGNAPTIYSQEDVQRYVQLWNDGEITRTNEIHNPDMFPLLDIDCMEPESPQAARGAAYCLCTEPKVEPRFAGIGSC